MELRSTLGKRKGHALRQVGKAHQAGLSLAGAQALQEPPEADWGTLAPILGTARPPAS